MNGRDFDLAANLHRLGLGSIAAALLDGLAPLAPLGAQGMYLLEPLLGPGDGWRKVARTLEDPARFEALASDLRHGAQHGEH
jgi:hypothetical protein